MGGSVRRFGCLCLLALGVVVLSPASAGAVTLGSHHIDPTLMEFNFGCNSASCTYVQTRLPGAEVRAPFSGEVRKWRFVSPGNYDFQLSVMHKKPTGKFKNVGESSVAHTTAAGEYEYFTDIPIHEGDYVGLISDTAAGFNNDQAKGRIFDPAVQFADSQAPGVITGPSELQFNATVRR